MATFKAEFVELVDELFLEFADFLIDAKLTGIDAVNLRNKEFNPKEQTVKCFKLNKKESFSVNNRLGNMVEIPVSSVNFLGKFKDFTWIPSVNTEEIELINGDKFSINHVFVDPAECIVMIGCK